MVTSSLSPPGFPKKPSKGGGSSTRAAELVQATGIPGCRAGRVPDPNSTNPTPDGETPREPWELLEPSISSTGRRVLSVVALKALEGLKAKKKKRQ